MRQLLLLCLLIASCGKRTDLTDTNNRLGNLERTVTDHEIRLSMLEQINHLSLMDVRNLYDDRLATLEVSLLNTESSLISAQQELAELDYIITGMQASLSLIATMNDSLAMFESRLDSIETTLTTSTTTPAELADIRAELIDIHAALIETNTRLDNNDLFTPIPGCEHSYFALYNGTGKIQSVWVTEGNGTVAGAWQLEHNKTYNLLIDGSVVCTNVRMDKNAKTLQYGTNIIDLSY